MTFWWKLAVFCMAVAAIFFAGDKYRATEDKIRLATALDYQENELHAQCDKEKAVTKEANDALQKNMDTITAERDKLKRVHPATCILSVTRQAKLPAVHGKHAGQDGISSDWLRDYAATCEEIRQTAVTCEKFIDDERK